MTDIANFFQCKKNYVDENLIIVRLSGNNKHHLTKSYFDKYPLVTSKRYNYLSFLQELSYLDRRLTDKEIFKFKA